MNIKNSWDGMERRKNSMSQEYKELLIRLEEKMINISDNLGSFMKRVDSHIIDDIACFKELGRRVALIEKIAFLGIGGLVVLQFILKYIKI